MFTAKAPFTESSEEVTCPACSKKLKIIKLFNLLNRSLHMEFNVSHGPHLQVETYELKYCNYCFCPET
jgi:hypothetical protein